MANNPILIHFSSNSLIALNICLAFIMFGVSLDLKVDQFLCLRYQKKSILTGLFSQIILLPFITYLLVLILPISKGMALGMLLVAACPGGNVSNFFSMLAKGNVALSVALTATSSLLAFIITPINFFMWASFVPGLETEIQGFQIDFTSLVINMVLVLLFPLLAGMWVNRQFPSVNERIGQWLRSISMGILALFILLAFTGNHEAFIEHIHTIFWIVLLHNGAALFLSYSFSITLKNDEATNRTIAIETGIQNSGLGLVLIFTFFNGNTDMAIVAAWWGIWHLISGFTFAMWMRTRSLVATVK